MNRVIINLEALYHNLQTIRGWMQGHDASWTVVTKVLCGHQLTLQALSRLGVASMGESRLQNLRAIREVYPEAEAWFLRGPNLSSAAEVVSLSTISLNSEIEVIQALNKEAGKQGRVHRIIIMIELGDLREGILPGTLVRFYERAFTLPHIEVIGIGANLGCLAGAIPTVDQFMQLVLYRELLELKFGRELPMISAGSSVSLPLVLDRQLPRAINHFRIGEALFLGTDLIGGGTLPGLRADTVTLEAEIIEVKEKSLVPLAETCSVTPFGGGNANTEVSPGQRGYRVLLSVGQLDTEVAGLKPENSLYQVAGGSSDITVINVGSHPGDLRVGGTLRFRLSYGAMLRLMAGRYVTPEISPGLEELDRLLVEWGRQRVPHVLDAEASTETTAIERGRAADRSERAANQSHELALPH